MSDIKDIFKAYDIRGKVGDELSVEVVRNIGRAFSDWLPGNTAVAVGRDMRPDSKNLAGALIAGIRMQGRDVIDIGQVTSDMIYFATGHLGLSGGAMITASHNPGEYNGIKLCKEEAKPIGIESGLLEIRDKCINKSYSDVSSEGKLITKDVIDGWIQHVLKFIDTKELKKLKVVVDAGNGMAGKIFPAIEPHLPFDVTEMYFKLDGTFPNHIANPLEPKNLEDLISKIKSEKADVGIAFDGDGDRAVLVDEKGEPLTGTVMTTLLADYFLDKYPGATILVNAICGRVASETIKDKGGTLHRTRVGHSFIKSDMRKFSAIFAGEHSGHYYFKDNFMADSGLIAAVIALSILCQSNKKLSELAKPYRSKYTQIPETNFVVNDKVEMLKKISKKFNDGSQNRLDGLTINYDYGWLNVRPSNTEPLLRLNAEAKTSKQLKNIVDRVSDIISQ